MAMRLLLALALGSALLATVFASASATPCDEAGACEPGEDDKIALLQARRATNAPVSCSGGKDVPQGSNSNNSCAGNQCCPEYSKTFPCPNADAAWVATSPCVLPAMQSWPTYSPDLASPAAPLPAVPDAYIAHVVTPADVTLSQALEDVSGIEHARVIERGEPDYHNAFYPPVVANDTYYTHSAYPLLWGDLGSVMQPGFGGLVTYSAVEIRPSQDEPLHLFRLANWNSEKPGYMCSIWWGFESTYRNSLVNASIEIATCSDYSAIMMCRMRDDFTAIVGQGWALSPDGFMERKCSDAAGQPKQPVARRLADEGYPKPPDSTLQVVVPACQIARSLHCRACQLPTDPVEKQKLDNVAEYVKNPPAGATCMDGRLEQLQNIIGHHATSAHHHR